MLKVITVIAILGLVIGTLGFNFLKPPADSSVKITENKETKQKNPQKIKQENTQEVKQEDTKYAIIPKGLFVDLDANLGVLTDNQRVQEWQNQVKTNSLKAFKAQKREDASDGRPTLKEADEKIGKNNTILFNNQELVTMDEDIADHMITGSGYTWFSVMSVSKQTADNPHMNCFFGNIGNEIPYSGFFAGFKDDNVPWAGTRTLAYAQKKSLDSSDKEKKPLWNRGSSPYTIADRSLVENEYYILIGSMSKGHQKAKVKLFINSTQNVFTKNVIIKPKYNSSALTIGKQRTDVTNESFNGEIARFLLYDRPLSKEEIQQNLELLKSKYTITSEY